MRFLSVHLSNYIGIYNGMGLYDINIDFTKCRHRMTIIRGDNGSGKSTLSKAMNLFPDSNDSFIPGMEARKELMLLDGANIYFIQFVHGIKTNGEREVTKAYVSKSDPVAGMIELNKNGNVSSYKDIIYSELGLDANFIALSQLSTEDRGLADKKPAERKRFVNAIISSLDVYNNIYKILTKKSSNYKSMINTIVGKLNVLGDETSVANNLEAIENKINTLNDRKDKAFANMAKAQSTIQILDPDGTIQSTNTVVSADLDLAEKEYKRIQEVINSLITQVQNTDKNFDAKESLKKIVAKKNDLIINCQILRNKVENLLNQKEQEAIELNRKTQRLTQLTSGENYEDMVASLNSCNAQLQSIHDQLMQAGVDNPESISKDEYILALETLKDLDGYISSFKSATDFNIIENMVNDYIRTGSTPNPINIELMSKQIQEKNQELESYKTRKQVLESKLSLLNKLELRPKACTISDCPFIRESLDFSNTNPLEEQSRIDRLIVEAESDLKNMNAALDMTLSYNEALARFNVIVREVNKNAKILSKLKNGDMFSNKQIFFERLLNGYAFDYMKNIYRYIDLANLFDTYKSLSEVKKKYEDEIKLYESKSDILIEIQNDIDRINRAVSVIIDQIEPIQAEVGDKEKDIVVLKEMEALYTAIIDNQEKLKPVREKIQECRNTLADNSRKINEINMAIAAANLHKETISHLSYELDPLMKERDKLSHSVQLISDYKKELADLQANYEFIDNLKFYSSPTTGIQLVFMELYMGKVIALANQLLGYLFNGKFVIQPFVINESEFRIPCLGDGYINDDISSMSSSQVAMISMILSFSLLHNSSTKYNIIKLDEIDGPLDYNNRLYFMDVLNAIMDIMHTEQCIIISHNSELQLDNSDIILLKHDESNTDYMRGNIIWSY